jgi:rubrerythrin
MSTHAELGMNRTGVSMSPRLTAQMVEGNQEFPPDYVGDESKIARSRGDVGRTWQEPVGSMPPPLTLKGNLKAGMTALRGESPTQLIDKLGARCAYERSGVRLYEAVLAKFDISGSFAGGPARTDLEQILAEELSHFRMLTGLLTDLGADPTVMTPSADLEATMTQGILGVLVDPRTTLAQCLEALLAIELIDNDSWTQLEAVAREAGLTELVESCTVALSEEQVHLARVRAWMTASLGLPAS